MLAAIALVGSSVSAWAAAGLVGEPTCCCPVKKTCKCHDHDGKRDASPTLKRCGGDADRVAPVVAAAIPPVPMRALDEPRVLVVAAAAPAALPESHTIEIEKPPF